MDQVFINEKFGITHTRKPAPKRRAESFSGNVATGMDSDDSAEKPRVSVQDRL